MNTSLKRPLLKSQMFNPFNCMEINTKGPFYLIYSKKKTLLLLNANFLVNLMCIGWILLSYFGYIYKKKTPLAYLEICYCKERETESRAKSDLCL